MFLSSDADKWQLRYRISRARLYRDNLPKQVIQAIDQHGIRKSEVSQFRVVTWVKTCLLPMLKSGQVRGEESYNKD